MHTVFEQRPKLLTEQRFVGCSGSIIIECVRRRQQWNCMVGGIDRCGGSSDCCGRCDCCGAVFHTFAHSVVPVWQIRVTSCQLSVFVNKVLENDRALTIYSFLSFSNRGSIQISMTEKIVTTRAPTTPCVVRPAEELGGGALPCATAFAVPWISPFGLAVV